jgi:hypothetical protein
MTAFTAYRLAAAGAALGLVAMAPAFAQTTTKPAAAAPAAPQQVTRAQVAQQLDAEFKDLDANKDGKLTKTEIETAMSRRAAQAQAEARQQLKTVFDKIDTNHNGSISLAEFQAQQKITMNPQMVDQRVQQLDTNKDGSISAEEYRNGTLVQFDKLDTNHDGIVSAAEAGAAESGGGR